MPTDRPVPPRCLIKEQRPHKPGVLLERLASNAEQHWVGRQACDAGELFLGIPDASLQGDFAVSTDLADDGPQGVFGEHTCSDFGSLLCKVCGDQGASLGFMPRRQDGPRSDAPLYLASARRTSRRYPLSNGLRASPRGEKVPGYESIR